MMSQMIGSSIIAFPFVVYKLGWVLTTFVMAHSIVMMLVTMYYYTVASYYTQASSYKDLVLKILGKKFGLILDISLVVSYYGFMTAYVIISSNGIITMVQNNFNYKMNPYIVKVVIAFCIILPLCLLKSLKQLSKISTIASLIIVTFVISIAVYFFKGLGNFTLCSYDGHDIKYSLPAFPRVSVM